MPRPRRSIAVLCIVAIAFAAFLPGISAFDVAVVGSTWILLRDLASVPVDDLTAPADEQPVSLLSLAPSRAPPATSLT